MARDYESIAYFLPGVFMVVHNKEKKQLKRSNKMKTKFLISFLLLTTGFLSFSADNEIVTRIIDGKEIQGRLHLNGGGFVALTAFAGPKVFVDKNALILDKAAAKDKTQVLNYAKMLERAEIRDNVVLRDNAKVRTYAFVGSDLIVKGNKRIDFGLVQTIVSYCQKAFK